MMNNKGAMEQLVITIFIIVLAIGGYALIYGKGVGSSWGQVAEFSKFQDTDNDGVTDYLESVQGTCACDREITGGKTSERYYLIKEDLYATDIKPWHGKEAGYLNGYFDGKLSQTNVLIENPKPYLRLSESEVDTLYDLFQKENSQSIKLADYNFEFVDFTPNAELKDLCIPKSLPATEECTYTQFVSDLLETDNQKPTGCKTDPDTCSRMREEKAAEDKSK
ncbi:hypothetical protein JXA48_01515 [Candidatus Woesearchaeota archaeon]|nr:hypothetical protein [Candidatus Woesearchaeota archaeon]